MNRMDAQAEQISGVLFDWLKAEVITSGEGNNRILDATDDERLKAIRISASEPYESDDNLLSAKQVGHLRRMAQWMDLYRQTSPASDDFEGITAQVAFAPKMELSGAVRKQAYLQAQNSRGYRVRRQRAIGIDLEEAVRSRLDLYVPKGDIRASTLTLDALKKMYDDTATRAEIRVRNLVAMAAKGIQSWGKEDSISVRDIKKSQVDWVQATTDSIILAAKMRGGELEAVPFWEPLSISYQSGELHYPFAGPIDWMKIVQEKGVWPAAGENDA